MASAEPLATASGSAFVDYLDDAEFTFVQSRAATCHTFAMIDSRIVRRR
jgi:hypothetical protein